MKKILLSLLLFAPILLFGQITPLDSLVAQATGGTRYQFLKLDSTIIQVNKHIDSIAAHRTLIDLNTAKVTMTYPGIGIPLSTGSGWAASITNNSGSWNTAYSWGDHAEAGYLTSSTEFDTTTIYTHLDSIKTALADTASLVAGTNITIDTSTPGEITINATGGGATYDTTYLYSVLSAYEARIEALELALESLGDFDLTSPSFASAEIGTWNDSILVAVFDTTDTHVDSISQTSFALTEDTNNFGIDTIYINSTGDSLFIALDSVAVFGSTYLFSYTRGDSALQDSTGNEMASFSNMAVTNNVSEISSYTSQYQAVLDAITTDPTGDTLTWQNALVDSLVTRGYWARMDLFYVFANRNSQAALLNWVAPTGSYNATDGNSTTFTPYEGFTGDGSSDYLTTNWNPNTDGDNFVLNSASIGVYIRSFPVEDNTHIMSIADTDAIYLQVTSTSTIQTFRMNATSSITSSANDGTGLTISTRRASDDVEGYRNGSSVASGTIASTGIPSRNMPILARNSTGTIGNFSGSQISIAFVMDGITDGEATIINTLIETYMDSIGKGVE